MHVVRIRARGDFSDCSTCASGRHVENQTGFHTKIGDGWKLKCSHPDEEMAVRHESGRTFGVENRMMQNTLVFTLPPSVRRFRGVFLRRDAQTVVFEFKIRVVKRRI